MILGPLSRSSLLLSLAAALCACSSNDAAGDACTRAVTAMNACSGAGNGGGAPTVSTCSGELACEANCILAAPSACDFASIARCTASRCQSGSFDSGVGGDETATTLDSGTVSDDTAPPPGTSAWRCADNGSNCLCYDPAPTGGYTLLTCGDYACCWADEGGGERDCECLTTSDCAGVDHGPSAIRVAHCPP